ncbi:ABC transporter substrate-binding protein [Cellulomonas edaphi]|uniref:ABC transporter substrate-binding protein n=1 Tax=Cellulomonas edaphi TaxID=3053468 RepID=A0ABT7S296_9CELL|nr:ABC transporter substrate-binding protein [Cellulomons edaphi]MDM7829737.1 ABC transporter substrate-binding protein [Cellulomons edaphi]
MEFPKLDVRTPVSHPRKLRTLLATVLAVTALALAGCSSSADDDTPASTPSASADSAFPVTLTDKLGSATITKKPERIVTIGWASQDVVAALGTAPVGSTDFTWGTVDKYLPWFADRVKEIGGELPEIVTYAENDEVDAEQVLALDPDLILAVHSGITENEYAKLSEIAPTIAYKDAPWTSDWKELTTTIGAAMGQSAEAAKLVADTEKQIATAAAAHPEFKGVTFTYGWTLADGATALDLYFPQDPRVQLMEQLGFVSSPQVVALSKEGSAFYGSVSLEKLDTVESQFHLAWANTPADVAKTVDNPLVKQWAPIAKGSYYFMEDQAQAWASSQPSVLSIPWQLDSLLPELSSHLHP